MSGEQPAGDAAAVVTDGDETHFIDLGPVWVTEKGNLTFTMHAEPLAWRAGAPRRVVIRPRRDVKIEIKRDPK